MKKAEVQKEVLGFFDKFPEHSENLPTFLQELIKHIESIKSKCPGVYSSTARFDWPKFVKEHFDELQNLFPEKKPIEDCYCGGTGIYADRRGRRDCSCIRHSFDPKKHTDIVLKAKFYFNSSPVTAKRSVFQNIYNEFIILKKKML